jgi:ELWxxDGT repeat protein
MLKRVLGTLKSLKITTTQDNQHRNRRRRLSQLDNVLEQRLLLAGTYDLLKDINPGSSDSLSEFSQLTEVNGILFFMADDGTNGRELWKSDGTAAGTVLVKDINPGSASGLSSYAYFANVNGTLIFSANDGTSGVELWKSDGTEAGTVLVKDIHPGSGSSSPGGLGWTSLDGTLYFASDDGVNGSELWKTDGTTSGTVLVKDITPGSGGSFPGEFVEFQGQLFFEAESALWKSDGTAAGTGLVDDQGSPGGIYDPVVSGGKLYFKRFTQFTPPFYSLWRSDGTSAGTIHLVDADPWKMVDLDGTLYFDAVDSTNGNELWKSDGTVAGTVLVKDLNPGSANGLPYRPYLTNVNGKLFFQGTDGTDGNELWMSDGTSSGTVLVKDINSGVGDSLPSRHANVNGVLYFNATDGVSGKRPWKSDGTAAGTVMLSSATGAPDAVDPVDFTLAGGNLFFAATTSAQGRELFVADSSPTDPPGSAPTITAPAATTTELRPTISWTAVADATEYEIWIKNQSTDVNPFYTTTVAGTSHVPTVDLGIGRFNLWIRAKNSVGNGPWTTQYNFTVNTRATVDDPGRFLPTHRPTLTWPALPGAVKYDLWVDDKLAGVSQFIRDQNVTGTSWTPASDMPIGLYHAWIRGIAADGTSGGWSVTTIFYVVPPPVVTQGMNPTFDRTPTFAWDSLLGAVKYEVFIRNRNTGATTLYQQNITELNFTPPSDLADGPYRVWVIGVSAVNARSYWTDPIDIYVGGRTDVLTPANQSTVGTTPTFSWRPVDDDSGGSVTYNLWVTRVGVQDGYINVTGLTTTSYTHGTALPTGAYRAWVQAVSSSNEKIWSLVSDFTVADVDDIADGLSPQGEALLAFHLPLVTPPEFAETERREYDDAGRDVEQTVRPLKVDELADSTESVTETTRHASSGSPALLRKAWANWQVWVDCI